ncbi:MAG: hypothetical protein IIU55_00550 [Paludibacteraceae bacterium]|nr:hypothetical protein [Paludibacteraceae bacterium]
MRKVFILLMLVFCWQMVSAATDTIRLEFDHFAQGPKYYSSGDWYVVLENAEDWEVYLNWKAPKDNYCGTFRINKFLDDYSYIFTPDNRENGGIHFKNIIMKIATEDVTPLLQKIELNATITGTDGNIYIVHATHEVLNVKDEVDVSILDAEMAVEDDAYTITGKNDDWDIAMKVKSANVIGTYNSMDYFDLDESHFLYQGQAITPLQLEAQVGVGYMADSVLAYMAQCNMLGLDTVIYHMLLAVPFADPVDRVDLACANMRIDDTYAQAYNMMTISASNDDYEVQIMYKDNALREQTYTEAQAQVYVTDKQAGTQVESLTCKIHVEKQATGDYQVRGEARCTNNVVYNLQLAWVIPDRADTVALRFEQTARASYYPQMNNDLLFINSNDRYTLNLNVVGVEMGGAFTMENVGDYYTSLYDNELEKDLELAQVEGRIYQSGDTTWIEAEMLGFNATVYDVQIWYAVPEPEDTVELVFEEVPFTNHLEEGYYQLIAYTDDQMHMVSFTPASHEVEGTFVNDGLFGRFGKGRYDFFNDYTYIQEWNPKTNQYETYTVEKGEMVVSMAADGQITAQAEVICEDGKYYRITMYSQYERPHLDYDTEDGGVERVYGVEDNIKIEDLTQSKGFIIFQATAQDQSDMMVLYFFANEADDETTIPAGVYPINHSLMAGSVLASTGANEDNTVSPSIYATLTDGYMDQLYFMVDGVVTVEKKNGRLKLEVNAVNSYGMPVHVVYDGTAINAAVENLHSPSPNDNAQKMLRNGQLLIQYRSEYYTVLGKKTITK